MTDRRGTKGIQSDLPDTNTLKKEIVSAVTGVTELGKRLKAEVQDVVVANADYRRLKAVLKALK